MRRPRSAPATAVLTLLLALSCGGDEDDIGTRYGGPASPPERRETTNSNDESLSLNAPVNDHGTTTIADPEADRLGIELGDFYFAPTYVEMPPAALGRDIHVLLKNAGTEPHTFTAPELGVDELLAPGEVRTIGIELRDIPVEYVCRFHASRGMRGAFSFAGS